jgi:hypothetical protein
MCRDRPCPSMIVSFVSLATSQTYTLTHQLLNKSLPRLTLRPHSFSSMHDCPAVMHGSTLLLAALPMEVPTSLSHSQAVKKCNHIISYHIKKRCMVLVSQSCSLPPVSQPQSRKEKSHPIPRWKVVRNASRGFQPLQSTYTPAMGVAHITQKEPTCCSEAHAQAPQPALQQAGAWSGRAAAMRQPQPSASASLCGSSNSNVHIARLKQQSLCVGCCVRTKHTAGGATAACHFMGSGNRR